jgi:protein RecA
MPIDPSSLDKALAAIRKEYGDGSIHTGTEKPPLERIPFGSVQLDWATGGGFPLGRWGHFYGGYSSAKTLTCWNLIKSAQELGLTCAYYNLEKQYDEPWVAARGVDVEKLYVVEGTTIEGTGERLEALLGAINVHVIDSLASAVSVDELAGETTDWNPGIQARAWGKVLRRANERFDDSENAIIMINQTREMFGARGAESPTSGRFVEYMSSMSLHFKRSGWLFRDKNGFLHPDGSKTDSVTGDTEPSGIEFQVRVAKSRVGPPLRSARMRLDFDTGEYDELWALTRGAVYFGVVKQSGSWYTVPGLEKAVQGENGVRQALINDPELMDQIRNTILSS